MEVHEFLRVHSVRAPHVAWLLGAGASAAAGIPTAWQLLWDFKRTLYSARERVPLRALDDLGDAAVRRRIQRLFDGLDGFPADGAADEYSRYFEAAYPTEADRQRVIRTLVEGGRASYGHYALASLMRADRIRTVWTTNFDRLVEDAAAELFRTTARLTVADLGHPEVATQAMTDGRWPLLGKLHGDFQSRLLKNTSNELRDQDVQMRGALVESCRRGGLAVVGYSGRDDSVMATLEEALGLPSAFPQGLFWFHRNDAAPLPRVDELVECARRAGVDAHLIEMETFDELMSDLLLLENVPADVMSLLDSKRTTRADRIQAPTGGSSWPVLRLNALPVISWPTTCRLVRCDIGGTAAVRQAIAETATNVVAARRRSGVICFGSDQEVRTTFEQFGINEFGLYAIEQRRLRYESADLGLLYDAIGRAVARETPLVFEPRARKLSVDPTRTNDPRLGKLTRAVGAVVGVVPGVGTPWREAAAMRLELRHDRLWLLLEPTVWCEKPRGIQMDERAREFVRGRLSERFNVRWNAILDAWIHLVCDGDAEREVRALGIADGVDAVFKLGPVSGFSRRAAG